MASRLFSVLSVAITLSFTGLPSVSADEMVIEEVIVTAQKREQSSQDVPIAVSAFDQEFLSEAGIDDVMELQFFVPGLTIYNNQSAAQTNINIRGVGTAGNSISLESSVGLYVDGVYRSRQSSGISDLVDIERVEVLKGPQGTLFGKNTASGAIQFLTAKPNLNEAEGSFAAQGGSENYRNFTGVVSVPIVEGESAFRLSAGSTRRDGYIHNLTTGGDLNDRDRYNLRAQFLYDNNEGFNARLIADYAKLTESCCAGSNVFDGPGDTTAGYLAAGGTLPPAGNLPGTSFLLPLDFLSTLVGFTGTPVVLASQYGDDIVAQDIDPLADIRESGVSLELNWDLSDVMTLTSISAHRTYDSDVNIDADFNSLDILNIAGGPTRQDTFSQELRLTGSLNESTTYVVGAYYFDQQLNNENALGLGNHANTLLTGGLPTSFFVGGAAACPLVGISDEVCNGPAFPGGEYSNNISTQDQTSWAVFAQADFGLTEDLVLTAGLRYLDEEKKMNVTFFESIFSPVWAILTPLSPFVPDVDNETYEDTAITGTVRLSYFLADDIMAYAAVGRGYKSGGTNVDRIAPNTGAPQLFDPETSDSIEIGLKGDFLQKRVRVNLAAHQTDFDEFQENTFVGTGFVLQNAGSMTTKGFEADVIALISPWLSFSGGAAYVDAEYESFIGGGCIRTPYGAEPDAGDPAFPTVCDASGNRVGGTPEWSYYASLTAERPIGDGFLYGRFDYTWRDDTVTGTNADPNKMRYAFGLANIRVGYRFGGDQTDISLWAKNAFDETYRGGPFDSVIRQGSLSDWHTEPRTVGLTLRRDF